MSMQQYLARYAEPESRALKALPFRYAHVVCIPAFAEAPDFIEAVTAQLDTNDALFVVVLNAHPGAPAIQQLQTRSIAAWLRRQYPKRTRMAPHCSLLETPRHDILLVERCHRGAYLGAKEGVGKARKIACDIACKLIHEGSIESDWIHCTDADATLPPDYLTATGQLATATTSAGLYPFYHRPHPDPLVARAQALYDLTLEYYVAGLAWAGSSWAFHTIGSTLVINAHHYADVRGFPIRQAGEDFYLLGKLAKTAAVVPLATTAVSLETRVSDRVPFGTGPALGKLLAMQDPLAQYTCYHPQSFTYLQCWLALSETLWRERVQELDAEYMRRFMEGHPGYSELDYTVLQDCLGALGIDKALNHALDHSRSEKVFKRHMSNRFDAFQTLKFIHWLRDHHLPPVPVSVIQDGTCLPFGVAPERNVPVPPALNR